VQKEENAPIKKYPFTDIESSARKEVQFGVSCGGHENCIQEKERTHVQEGNRV
jgi:hypothetical protein